MHYATINDGEDSYPRSQSHWCITHFRIKIFPYFPWMVSIYFSIDLNPVLLLHLIQTWFLTVVNGLSLWNIPSKLPRSELFCREELQNHLFLIHQITMIQTSGIFTQIIKNYCTVKVDKTIPGVRIIFECFVIYPQHMLITAHLVYQYQFKCNHVNMLQV